MNSFSTMGIFLMQPCLIKVLLNFIVQLLLKVSRLKFISVGGRFWFGKACWKNQ